ncbi:MAG: DUF4232 domain-containing protein [Streptosporangiaceae bacterium]
MSHLAIRPRAGRLATAAGAVVATCALSLAACAATATTAAHASPSAPAISTCTGATDLHLRIPRGHKSAGITYYTLDFTNTSSSTCSLSGFPYVSMITRAGRQLGSPAGRARMTVVPLVKLAPGATAHTTLAYYGGKVSAASGCGPVATAYELRAYVAGEKRALYTALGLHSCSRAGRVYLMITESFRAGAGAS